MPLNNSINKTSDTFFATSNITANFTSPITSVLITASGSWSSTYTPAFSALSTTALDGAIYCEAYSNLNGAGLGTVDPTIPCPTIILFKGGGTKASPSNTNSQAPACRIYFVQRGFGVDAITSASNVANFSYGIALQTQVISTGLSRNFLRVDYTGTWIRNPVILCNTATTTTSVNPFTGGQVSTNTSLIQEYTSLAGKLCVTQSDVSPVNDGSSRVFSGLYKGDNTTGAILTLSKGRSFGGLPNNGDTIYVIQGGGIGYPNAGVWSEIRCQTDGTTSFSTSRPSRFVFLTIPINSTTLTEAMRLDNAGRVTQIRQPSFSASLDADQVNATGDGTAFTIPYDVEQYDQSSDFAANTFTAPIAGKYRFNWTISVDDLLVGHTKMEVTVGGQTVCRVNPYAIADSDGFCLLNGSVDLSLAASATVTMVVTITGSTKTVTVKGTTTSGTFLSGQLQV